MAISSNSCYSENVTFADGSGYVNQASKSEYYWYVSPAFQAIQTVASTYGFISTTPNYLMGSTLSDVVQKARDLCLSKEDKALRKAGFKNDCNQWTDAACRIYLEMLMDNDEDSLVEKADELIEEEDAKKKKCKDC